MAWIRLSDDYINDEKIFGLSDGAFRLWHEGMAYCRRHQTDGSIPFVIMRGLRSFSKGREKELSSSPREGVSALWELVPAMGYRIHNYLDWNLSKEEEANERAGNAARQRKFRDRDKEPRNGVSNALLTETRNALVPDRIGIGKDLSKEKRESDSRSNHPMFKGQRLVVFDWMVEKLMRMLGSHVESFDLHEWFFELDARVTKSGQVIPSRDGGAWLEAQTLAEAKRRGLPFATGKPSVEESDAQYRAETQAQADRVLALLKQERSA